MDIIVEGTRFKFRFCEKPDETLQYCAYAKEFQTWAEVVLEEKLAEPDHLKIAQAKVLILDKYYEWKLSINPRHGRRHLCIDTVLDDAYFTLKQASLKITPPQLYFPKPERKPRKVKETPDTHYITILGEYED